MANTTYKDSIRPQFQGVQAQDVSFDLSQPKEMLGELAQGLEQEAKTLQDIAQDESQIAFNQGAATLVDKYGTDYKGLNGALLKLEQENYNKFGKSNPRLANDLLRQQDAVRLRAVKAARNKYVNENNRKIKEGTGLLLEGFKLAMPDDYANYLDTIRKPAEMQDTDLIGQWENNLQEIDKLLNRRDMDGNYIFDSKTRKYKPFIQDYMLHGAKNMIDRFITNDDKAGLEDYYQAHILAPERYMKQTGQDRDTYDKVKKYAETQLKRYDVDGEKLKFKQSVQDAMGLMVEYTPEKMAELRETEILPTEILDSIEKTNVKFEETGMTEPILPTNFLNISKIVSRWEATPGDATEEEQLQTMVEANDIMNTVADYAKEYGMADTDVEAARKMVLDKATHRAYGELMRTFGDVTNGMGTQIANVEESILRNRQGKNPKVNIPSLESTAPFDETSKGFRIPQVKPNYSYSAIKYKNKADIQGATAQVRLLDQLLRDAYTASQQALDSGDLEQIPKIQRAVQVQAAHIKYMYHFNDNDWIAWEADKDHEFHDKIGGGIYRVKEITPQGDIITETIR